MQSSGEGWEIFYKKAFKTLGKDGQKFKSKQDRNPSRGSKIPNLFYSNPD